MLADRIRRMVSRLATGLQEREEVIRLTVLAAIAEENVFLYGPPGVAKSLLARRIASIFRDATVFEYLLGPFTTPEELFGPVSISRLKDADRFERVTDGFLPSADIVFLDEIWNASSPILNTLLTAINERRFRNGSEELALPLKSVIGAASDAAPAAPGLINLWDRFLLRLRVEPIESDEAFLALINGDEPAHSVTVADEDRITPDELDEWRDARAAIILPPEIAALLLDIRERVRRHNTMIDQIDGATPIEISDRRWLQAARLLRTSALLNDRTTVNALDCVMLRHCLWSQEADVEPINTIVTEALTRYSSSGRFDPEPVRGRLAAIRSALRAASVSVRAETVEEPVEYRGEYFRVVDFVEDHLSLIWIGDCEHLSATDATPTDLFFYGEDDDYAYSDRLAVRRLGPTELEIEGESFHLETRTVERTVEESISLSDEERARIEGELSALRDEVRTVLEAIRDHRQSSLDEARAHLFVHRRYAAILDAGMDDAARGFSSLASEIGEVEHALHNARQ